ncbi:MAG: hypothetical protein INQ03_01510 [Candidatus Heimdallarchaeota archaeon]|nr:hypothetical protein [Candidatus Heimdallarchaeota archaeon]
MSDILSLSKVDILDLDLVGGKAANLGELIKAGINVPPGIVLSTKVFREFIKPIAPAIEHEIGSIRHRDLDSITSCAHKIRKIIIQTSFDDKQIETIKKHLHDFEASSVAVRSSATAEDLDYASFAGQQDTILNLKGHDSIFAGIIQCYASLYNARAIMYRINHKIAHNEVDISVIIQKMIPATSSGVLFTLNPINNNPDEMLIESTFGLGESLVSGDVDPDQIIIDKHLNKVIKQKIGKKEIIKRIAGDVLIQEQNEDIRSQCSISEEQIRQLISIAQHIENHYGAPQDIEWAFENSNLFIIQTRPITTNVNLKDEDEYFWTRGYADDYWNDPVSNLFYDLLGAPLIDIVNNELNSIMGYRWGDLPLLKLHKNHVYFNLQILKRKVENEIPGFIRGDDVLIYFPEEEMEYGKSVMKKLPFKITKRVVAELRVMLHDPDGAISNTSAVYHQWYQNKFKPFCNKFDIQLAKTNDFSRLIVLARDLEHIMIDHFKLVRYGLPVHNLGMNLLLRSYLERLIGMKDAAQFYPILISGLEHKTSETNDRIHQLLRYIREDDRLRKFIERTPSSNLYQELNNLPFHKFNKAFQQFITDFGDRGFTREPFYPRWREEPKYIFDLLQSLLRDNRDLDKIRAMNLQQKEVKERELYFRIRRQPFGWIRWIILTSILKFAKTYISFREMQRFCLDMWISRNRQVYLKIGENLTKHKILESKQDVFFLQKSEIISFDRIEVSEAEKTQIQDLIMQRREDFKRYEFITPPKFLHGSREFDDPVPDLSNSLKGVPASSGIASGTIRIVTNIDDLPLVRPGEILVVPKTDPGWTPVFSIIGGLITETGGVLSHGAVVSREYDIPAITNIRDACSIFMTGQRVRVDGNTGIVTRE